MDISNYTEPHSSLAGNRNIRIFRKIQQITTSPKDRILVLFGFGHIQLLKYFFECAPEFKLVKFGDLK